MIRHICMFQLKDNVNGKSKAENLSKAVELAQAIKEIPSVIRFEVVSNHPDTPESNYDLALIFDFDDIDGLNEYQVHPKHLIFAKFIHEARENRACIDYEL